MFNHSKIVGIVLCSVGLSACGNYNPNEYTNLKSYTYDAQPLYPESYEGESVYTERPVAATPVVVPTSYHMSENQSPTSFKDLDKKWVGSQDPKGYTIEVAEGDKAASVASKLYKAPKDQRTAQIDYQNQGKPYYKGLYGSYPSEEAAQQALQSLPDDVRQGANVKSWGSVQSTVSQ